MRSTEADFRRHVELLASAAGGPRTPGSAAHDWTQKYIRGCLASFGLRPWVQDNGPYGQNIVAEAGLEDGPLFVIGAHYDSVPGSPVPTTTQVSSGHLGVRSLPGRRPFRILPIPSMISRRLPLSRPLRRIM